MPKETFLAEVERELQKITIDWIGYEDPESKKMNSQSKKLEAEGSCLGSIISHSLMSISIDEDKDSRIKNWLNQNSDLTDLRKQKLQKAKTAVTSVAVASRSRGQPLKVVSKKNRSTERKGRRLSDRVRDAKVVKNQEHSHRNDISLRTAKFPTECHHVSTHCQFNNLFCPSGRSNIQSTETEVD